MTEVELQAEIKKAVTFFLDGTYEGNVELLVSHIKTIIVDNSKAGDGHKEVLERLMFKVDELRALQRKFWSGHKNVMGECKVLEKDLDNKLNYMQSHGGYSIARFKQEKPQQGSLL